MLTMSVGLQTPSNLADQFTWNSTDNAVEMSIHLSFRILKCCYCNHGAISRL